MAEVLRKSPAFIEIAIGLDREVYESEAFGRVRDRAAAGISSIEEMVRGGVGTVLQRIAHLEIIANPLRFSRIYRKFEQEGGSSVPDSRMFLVIAARWERRKDPFGKAVLRLCRDIDEGHLVKRQIGLEMAPDITEEEKALFTRQARAHLQGQDFGIETYENKLREYGR
jgi:hypothetical protein